MHAFHAHANIHLVTHHCVVDNIRYIRSPHVCRVSLFLGAIPIGIKRTKLRAQDEGQFYLNPPDSYLMEEDDAVVLIADDVDSFSFDSGPNCASDDTTFHMTLRHWTGTQYG